MNTVDITLAEPVLAEVRRLHRTGAMNFGVSFQDKTRRILVDQICYGCLHSMNVGTAINAVVDYPWGVLPESPFVGLVKKSLPDNLTKSHDYDKLLYDWIDWVINHSNWSDVVVTKNVDQALSEGIIYNPAISGRKFFQAAAAIRGAMYFPLSLLMWDYGRKNTSLTPNELYILSQYFEFGHDNKSFNIVSHEIGGGHQGFYIRELSSKAYHNFINNVPVNLSSNTMELRWVRSSNLWGDISNKQYLEAPHPISKVETKVFSSRRTSYTHSLDNLEETYYKWVNMNWDK